MLPGGPGGRAGGAPGGRCGSPMVLADATNKEETHKTNKKKDKFVSIKMRTMTKINRPIIITQRITYRTVVDVQVVALLAFEASPNSCLLFLQEGSVLCRRKTMLFYMAIIGLIFCCSLLLLCKHIKCLKLSWTTHIATLRLLTFHNFIQRIKCEIGDMVLLLLHVNDNRCLENLTW